MGLSSIHCLSFGEGDCYRFWGEGNGEAAGRFFCCQGGRGGGLAPISIVPLSIFCYTNLIYMLVL